MMLTMNKERQQFATRLQKTKVTRDEIDNVINNITKDDETISKVRKYISQIAAMAGCSQANVCQYFRRGIYNSNVIVLVERRIGSSDRFDNSYIRNTFDYKCAIANLSQYSYEDRQFFISRMLLEGKDPRFMQQIVNDISTISGLRKNNDNKIIE